MMTTRVDDVPGSTVGQPKRIQHLHPEHNPISLHVSAHHHNDVSNIGAFHPVVRVHRNDIGATGVSTGEGGEALVLVEKCRHVRAKKDRRAWTKR